MYQKRARHLVRSAWRLVQVHGVHAEPLLAGPLHVLGEAAEQMSAVQTNITCKPLVAAVRLLVWDQVKGKVKRGFAGKGPGSARRARIVAQQFRLTYDLDSMQPEQILDLLPREFDRFRDASRVKPVRARARSLPTDPVEHRPNP